MLRRARRAAARRTFTRGSADFARARVLAALDLLSWLDQRGQVLRDLTQADLDQWLIDGATTRRAVRYFLQWARLRGLAGDLAVPLPPRQEPARLLAEGDHIQQIDRCLTDEAMPWTCGSRECSSCCSGCWSALTGISISTAERWSQWAKRDWDAYVGQRAADDREDIDSRKPAKQTL